MSGISIPHAPLPMTQRAMPIGRREVFSTAGFACFFVVLSTVFVDVNSLTYLTIGTQRIGSPLILLACIGCYVCYNFRFWQGLGRAGRPLVFSIFLYMFISSAVKLIDFSDFSVYVTQARLQQVGASLVILLATSLAARNAVASGKSHTLIWVSFGVLLVSVALVFIGKAFGRSLYNIQGVHTSVAKLVSQGERSLGGFTNPNETGMAMAITAAFGFACLNRTKRRALVLGFIFLAGVACISTFSRSAMLAFVILGIAQVFSTSIFKNKTVVIVALASVIAFAWFVSEGYKQLRLNRDQERRIASFTELASGKTDRENTGYRFEASTVGLKYWMENPLFGHGIGTGSYVDLGMGVIALGPHNTFIWLLIESGIVPFAMFSIALAILFVSVFRCANTQVRILSLGIMTVYVCNCMVSHGIFVDNVFAAASGISCGALAGAKELEKTASTAIRMFQPVAR